MEMDPGYAVLLGFVLFAFVYGLVEKLRARQPRRVAPRGFRVPAGSGGPPGGRVTGTLVGYRSWALARDRRGWAVEPNVHVFPGAWEQGVASAQCYKRGRHVPPEEACDCGIYALWSPLHPYLPGGIPGAVSAWGKVIPAEGGFRAEHAQIVQLRWPSATYHSSTAATAAVVFPRRPSERRRPRVPAASGAEEWSRLASVWAVTASIEFGTPDVLLPHGFVPTRSGTVVLEPHVYRFHVTCGLCDDERHAAALQLETAGAGWGVSPRAGGSDGSSSDPAAGWVRIDGFVYAAFCARHKPSIVPAGEIMKSLASRYEVPTPSPDSTATGDDATLRARTLAALNDPSTWLDENRLVVARGLLHTTIGYVLRNDGPRVRLPKSRSPWVTGGAIHYRSFETLVDDGWRVG